MIERLLGNDLPEGSWLWCLHCERCYPAGEFRLVDGLEYCPYPDCDGDTHFDGWPVAGGSGPGPLDFVTDDPPQRGKVYPQYRY